MSCSSWSSAFHRSRYPRSTGGEQLCQRADDPIGLDGGFRGQALSVCIHPDGIDTEALRHFDFPFKIVTDHPGLGCCYTQGLHCMLVGPFVRFAETMLALDLDMIEPVRQCQALKLRALGFGCAVGPQRPLHA